MKDEQEKLHSGNIYGVKWQVLATDQKLGVRLWEESGMTPRFRER